MAMNFGMNGYDGQIILNNGTMEAVIADVGAELKSFKTPSGQELIWQGDPSFWPRSAPILFPIVGRLKNDSYRHGGKTYFLKQHGFARDSLFQVIHHDSVSASFRLNSNPETTTVYPFDFQLRVDYRIDEERLIIGYQVQNTGTGSMPFAIGAHPGFRWPLEDGKKKEDYLLLFEQEEQGKRLLLQEGLLTGEEKDLPWQGEILPLSQDYFAEDATILQNPKSTHVSFRPSSEGIGIKVVFKNFPFLGIWSKPGGNILCIEPWRGHASFTHEGPELVEKRDMILLPAAEIFPCSIIISAESYKGHEI